MFNPDPKPIKQEKETQPKVKKLGMRKCVECGERFQKSKSLQMACSIECAISDARKKEEKRQRIQAKKEKKEGLEKLKSVADWKSDLQVVVNWIVREIDKDLPCISHPNYKDFLRFDAGHAYTVKAHGDIRFNVHNIHKQSSAANERHGYTVEYQEGLRNRYGNDYLEMLEGLPLRWKGTAKEKYTIDNIKNIYLPNARQLQREMKAGAIFDRDQVNEIIGIYIND